MGNATDIDSCSSPKSALLPANTKCQATLDRTKSGFRKPFDVVKAENNQKSKT